MSSPHILAAASKDAIYTVRYNVTPMDYLVRKICRCMNGEECKATTSTFNSLSLQIKFFKL